MDFKSFVDPITNSAVFSQVDLRAHLEEIMNFEIPELLLPTFLHETTHHSCFASPVGNTIALLRMRAYRRAAAIQTGAHSDPWDILEDVLRQEALMEMYRPLAEGLACFSELDAVPGKSNAISDAMRLVFLYFGGRKSKSGVSDLNTVLFRLLYRARLAPELAERKENILAAKFDFESGGYLAGYMAVKSIWNVSRRKSTAAWDSELLVTFLRAYFYDDYALVGILLDPSKTEHAAVNAISTYMHERLKQLLTMDIEEALNRFEQAIGGQTTRRTSEGLIVVETSSVGLEVDKSMDAIGRDRMFRLYEELQSPNLTGAEKRASQIDTQRLIKRELLCLGSLDAIVKVNEHDRVLVYDASKPNPEEHPVFAAPAIADAVRGQGAGALEFYLLPRFHSHALVVSRGEEVVFVNFDGPIDAESKSRLLPVMTARAADLALLEEQEKNLEFVIEKEAIRHVRDSLKVSLPPAALTIYSWLATLDVGKDHWEGVANALLKGGLFALFDHDAEFLRGIAFLSVASSVEYDLKALRQAGEVRGIDVDQVLARAIDYEAKHGLRTFQRADDILFSLV